MQSFALGANGGVFIRSKGVFVSFLKRKICRNMIRKNKGIYTYKEKTIDLRTTPTFLSAIIHENTT